MSQCDELRKALEEIAALDYTNAAINGAAAKAVSIAQLALANNEAKEVEYRMLVPRADVIQQGDEYEDYNTKEWTPHKTRENCGLIGILHDPWDDHLPFCRPVRKEAR